MSKTVSLMSVVLGAGILLASGTLAAAEEGKPEAAKKLKVLVVAGGHGYDIKAFRNMFESYADMDCTFVDEKVGGEALGEIDNWPYDALVLYNYKKKLDEKQQENFLKLMDKGVGLVILHHAIYGYSPWPEYRKVVGVTSWLTASKEGVEMKIRVEDAKHPITQGVADFEIIDETYAEYQVDPNVHVLLTTDTPGNAQNLAWTHTYRNSPVCYLQLGHGPKAYDNKSYVTLVGNAIRWAAKK